ncbi:hypothetical protein N7468_008230 [Penicillium chermesinum]|uniref:CASTOR ACT domain-containing protein n=1 Tax=Penicillium chermesinum TaxID=63820 RepID=A0A9W9NRN2_9EURO|nr:uncharacterized protein N7468_008230 [Penicillium chermesinum]KAJ5223688.1 hypothetical protein N7468_008230 [Penicillium chermesinum]
MDSLTLIDAQVQLVEERLALVHIPLELYPYFFKSVLGIVFDEIAPLGNVSQNEETVLSDLDDGSEGSEYRAPAFLNVSITPVEVTLGQLDDQLRSRLAVSDYDYIAMQVIGQGLEAGKRVLELTSPLALAGISIFFISTYFSDYILVPLHSKAAVVSALESRGFQFENSTAAFSMNPFSSPTSPRIEKSFNELMPPVTPPPSTLAELQTRTFANLRKNQIVPFVDDTLRLVQCAAHHQYNDDGSSMSILRNALTTVLLVDAPRFLSLTLAALDPAASLLLEERLLPRFARASGSHQEYEDGSGLLLGFEGGLPTGRLAETKETSARPSSGDTSLVGSNESSVVGSVPALFDTFGTRLALGEKKHNLDPLPPTSMHHLKPDVDPAADAVEISFLSTARCGTIIVGEHELRRAIDALDAETKQESSEEADGGVSLDG